MLRKSSLWSLMGGVLCSSTLITITPGETRASNLDAKFALHRVPVTPDSLDGCGADSRNVLGIPCSEYTVTAPLGESYVFVVVGKTGDEGVTGVQFGVNYDGRRDQMNGIDPALTTFSICNAGGLYFTSDYGFGDFPNPNGQLRAVFENYRSPTCYEHPILGNSGRHALIGYFYVYAHSEDVLRLIVSGYGYRPGGLQPKDAASGTELLLMDCAGNTIDLTMVEPFWPIRLGKVHFGGDGSKGYNPCAITPAFPTTWGDLKARRW